MTATSTRPNREARTAGDMLATVRLPRPAAHRPEWARSAAERYAVHGSGMSGHADLAVQDPGSALAIMIPAFVVALAIQAIIYVIVARGYGRGDLNMAHTDPDSPGFDLERRNLKRVFLLGPLVICLLIVVAIRLFPVLR